MCLLLLAVIVEKIEYLEGIGNRKVVVVIV